MKRWHRNISGEVLAGGALVLGLALAIAAGVWWEYENPCIKSRDYQSICGGEMYCAGYDSDSSCSVYLVTPTYPCTRTECVARGVRHSDGTVWLP